MLHRTILLQLGRVLRSMILLVRPISGAGVVGHATLRELHWE